MDQYCPKDDFSSSVDFAEVILRQLHRRSPRSFFVPESFANSRVVELGCVRHSASELDLANGLSFT